jgi:N-acetyl-anhydromuramyl-L-alanine amidase AmpD
MNYTLNTFFHDQKGSVTFSVRKQTAYIAIHCAATTAAQDIDAKEIDLWHRQRGWLCIGYHYVIRRNGEVEAGRPETVCGAHVEGFNSVSIGICMVGGQDAKGREENNFTDAQWAALEALVRDLHQRYPKATIQGHRDFPKVQKFCPSFSVADWLKRVGI